MPEYFIGWVVTRGTLSRLYASFGTYRTSFSLPTVDSLSSSFSFSETTPEPTASNLQPSPTLTCCGTFRGWNSSNSFLELQMWQVASSRVYMIQWDVGSLTPTIWLVTSPAASHFVVLDFESRLLPRMMSGPSCFTFLSAFICSEQFFWICPICLQLWQCGWVPWL